MTATIHRSKVGTYHPAPLRMATPDTLEATREHWQANDTRADEPEAWTIHDSRGSIDGGSPCDECGACECESEAACCQENMHYGRSQCCAVTHGEDDDMSRCIGLSFSYVCLDGGDNLCEPCAEKEGIKVVACDCR